MVLFIFLVDIVDAATIFLFVIPDDVARFNFKLIIAKIKITISCRQHDIAIVTRQQSKRNYYTDLWQSGAVQQAVQHAKCINQLNIVPMG